MIFVDTGAWFSAFVPNDRDHAEADAWLAANSEPLITTDYVIDELVTLLQVRGERERARALGESLLNEDIAQVHWVSPDDVREAWMVFSTYLDKGWSFTDCVSYLVIQRRGIRTAFAFDDHFRQFGIVTVVPDR